MQSAFNTTPKLLMTTDPTPNILLRPAQTAEKTLQTTARCSANLTEQPTDAALASFVNPRASLPTTQVGT